MCIAVLLVSSGVVLLVAVPPVLRKPLKQCLVEWKVVSDSDRLDGMCRVAVRLLAPGSVVGRELRELSGSDRLLGTLYNFYFGLMEYAMVSLVERRIEYAHAIIIRVGRNCSNVLRTYVLMCEDMLIASC